MKRRPLAGLLAAALVALVGAPVLMGSAEATTQSYSVNCQITLASLQPNGDQYSSVPLSLTSSPASPAAGADVTLTLSSTWSPNNGPAVTIGAGTQRIEALVSYAGSDRTLTSAANPAAVPVNTPIFPGGWSATGTVSAPASGSQDAVLKYFYINGFTGGSSTVATNDTFDSVCRQGTTPAQASTSLFGLTQTVTVGGGGPVEDPTTTALTSSLNPANLGASVTFTATVTGGVTTPTGTVTFKDGGTTLGTGNLNGSGTATFTTTSLAGGTRSITAAYGGDATHLPSVSSAVSQVVVAPAKTASATTLTATPASAEEGTAVALAATVTGAGGTPTGTVTFQDGAAAIGSPAALSAGAASASVTTLAVGARSLTAVYSGDAAFEASTSAAVPVTITPKQSTISTKTRTEAIDGLFCTVLNTSNKAWTAPGPAGGTPGPTPNFTFTVTPGAPAPGIQASVSLAYDAGPAPGPLDIPAGATVPKATVQVTGAAKPIVLVGPAFGAVPGYIANPTSRLPAATMTGTFTVPASGTIDLVTQSVAFDYKDPADPSSGFTWPDATPVEVFDTVCNKSATNTQTAPVPIGFTISVPVGTEKPLPDTKPPANGALTVTGTPTAGGQVTIKGSGFKPSSPVTVGIYSAPTFVGQFQTTAAGELSQAITLPGSLTGTHTIVAIGVDPASAQFVLEAPVTIAGASGGTTGSPDTGTSAGTLPQTGPGDSIAALVIGLIALQVGLVVAVRSHRALAPATRGGGRHRLGV